MNIKLIDFGYTNAPNRAHDNDAGADVYATRFYEVHPGQTIRMPLGFGLELPDGYAAFVYPRSGLSSKGIVCELPPIDSGYRGEVHAIISNVSQESYSINPGDRVGQLVVTPVIIVNYVTQSNNKRGTGAFASTGK